MLLLSGAFLDENRSRLGLRNLRLAAEAQAALLAYDWPGNVRELEHLISRSALKALSRQARRPAILTLTVADLGLEERGAGPPAPAYDDPAPARGAPVQPLKLAVESYQRGLIGAALRRHGDNWSAAARELGMDRANLARLAGRLGLRPGLNPSGTVR